MSISALLLGVETRLRSSAVLNDIPTEEIGKVCGVHPDGRPPNNCGQFYYAVHFLGVRNEDPNSLSGDWMYSVGVMLTARAGYAPKDRRGKRFTFAQDLLDRALAVAVALHQDDLHRIEANKLFGALGAQIDDPFDRIVRCRGDGLPRPGFHRPRRIGAPRQHAAIEQRHRAVAGDLHSPIDPRRGAEIARRGDQIDGNGLGQIKWFFFKTRQADGGNDNKNHMQADNPTQGFLQTLMTNKLGKLSVADGFFFRHL